jgi:hypothetical protein
MADALDSKSSDRKVVGVQVPPPVLWLLVVIVWSNHSADFFQTPCVAYIELFAQTPRDCAARHLSIWAGDLSSGRYQPSLATCNRSAAIRLTALRIARIVDSTVSVLAPVPR